MQATYSISHRQVPLHSRNPPHVLLQTLTSAATCRNVASHSTWPLETYTACMVRYPGSAVVSLDSADFRLRFRSAFDAQAPSIISPTYQTATNREGNTICAMHRDTNIFHSIYAARPASTVHRAFDPIFADV